MINLLKIYFVRLGTQRIINSIDENFFEKNFNHEVSKEISENGYSIIKNFLDENMINRLIKCYHDKKIPVANSGCDTCRWHAETKSL